MDYYMSWKKKELRAEIDRLEEERLDAKMSFGWWKAEAERLRAARDVDAKTIGALRIENERLVLTPEAKIDTEAAYQRGYQAARRNLRAWAVSSMVDLEAKLVVGDESPAVKINPTLLNQDPS